MHRLTSDIKHACLIHTASRTSKLRLSLTAKALGLVIVLLSPTSGALAVSTNFQARVLESQPVLYYKFNEPTGPAINYGSLGNAFNATYLGSPTRSVPTASGDAGVGFDSEDDYLESASQAPGSLTGNPTFTAEAVFFVPTTGGASLWAPFLHWGPSVGAQSEKTMRSVYFSFSNNDVNRLYVGFYNGGLRTSQPVALGQWHHIVWVRNGGGVANQGSTLYVDGVSVGLENDPALPSNGGTPEVLSTAFRVNRAQDYTRYFVGTLDELALYDRVLTGEEVLSHYAAFAEFARLSIERTGAIQARISWAPAVPGVVLQETLSLSAPTWTNSPGGTTSPVIISTTNAAKFYRLFRP